MKDRASPSSKKTKKPPLGQRIGRGLRAAGDLARRPQDIPKQSQSWFRRWLAKVWQVRGGGLYALGYAVTFLYFEARTLADEVAEADGVRDFIRSQIIEFIPRFAMESLANMIKALMWPVYVIQWDPMWGSIALGAGFVLFANFIKKPITRWLFPELELEDGENKGEQKD